MKGGYSIALILLIMGGLKVGYCQEPVRLVGRILDGLDTIPISNVAVYVNNKGLGTFSNNLGYFELTIPNLLRDDSIVVSHIGYESHKFLPPADSDTLRILLAQKSIVLEDVEIVDNSEFLINLVKSAFKKIRLNYPNRQHYLTGFFRQVRLQNNEYVRLIEAAVDIQDFGYKSDNNSTRIQVRQLRKSDFFGQENSLKRILNYFQSNRNQIYEVYQRNWIRTYLNNDEPPQYRFNETFADRHLLKIEGMTFHENDTIYVIGYQLRSAGGMPSNVGEEAIVLQPHGRLFINKKDLAIIRAEEQFGVIGNNSNSEFAEDYLFDKSNSNQLVITFRQLFGQYYLSSIEKVSHHGKKDFEFTSLLINDVITNKSDIVKIRKRFQTSKDIDLTEADFKYDSTFWAHYNVVNENLLDLKVLQDLERRLSLQQQFKTNGKND